MSILLIPVSVVAAFMTLLYVVSLIRRDNGTADIGYGIAVMLGALSAHLIAEASIVAQALSLLVVVWAVRLSTRIYRKNRGKPEDFRYRAWREAWGTTFLIRSFLQIYMLQGAIALLIASPVIFAVAFPSTPYMPLVILGIAVWMVGFVFESVGDAQLDRFIADPLNKGRIMTEGLWRYTRHPNYFGESLMWWGIALAASSATSVPLFAFASPILITYLLLYVSGVPMLEKRWAGNPEWEAYARRTSVFVPLPPRLD